MLFEIPQVDDPAANKIIQESTLSAGLGVTLTKHHHIRKYGRIHQDPWGKWHLTNRAKSQIWKEAADLGRDTSRSRKSHTPPVTRVVNLVLEPPGNVAILTPNNDLHISASLGYHMRHEKGAEGSSASAGGIPVYTFKDVKDLHDLPEFSQGIIHWAQGAVTRTPDVRLKFDKNKAIRRGRNLIHN